MLNKLGIKLILIFSIGLVVSCTKNNEVAYINAQLTLRAETLVNLDQEMSEKVLNIMEFMDDLDDVQEVHTNAEFPENFEVKD